MSKPERTALATALCLLTIDSTAAAQLTATAPGGHAAQAHATAVAARELLVIADDHTFDAPATVGSQSHELVIFRLEEGRRASDIVAWFEEGQSGPPPALPVGGVVGLAPGEEENVIEVDLERGRYAFICFLPDAKDGQPHFVHGMIQDYEVR